MRAAVIVAVAAALALGGCTDVGGQAVQEAAVSFVRSAPPEACALLAPDTLARLEQQAGAACAEALPGLALPTGTGVRHVEVAVQSAQVQLDDQVLFLARFPDGWRVTAAGCVRNDADPAVPYECEVEP